MIKRRGFSCAPRAQSLPPPRLVHLVGAAFAVAAVSAPPVLADCDTEALTVVNHSFESPVLADGQAALFVPGWTIDVNSFGVYNPPASVFSAPIPDGAQVAWSNSGFLSQTTPHIIELGYTYTLEVEVGDRLDASFGGGAIYLNNQVVSVIPPDGGFTTATVVYTPQPGDSQLGQSLRIRLQSGGVQALFDNVRLSRRVATTGGCFNRLVCDSIRWASDGGGSDYLSEDGARTFLPWGTSAQSRKTFQDYSGRTYVAGDGPPPTGGGPTYMIIRYEADGTLDEAFPSPQSPYYLGLPNAFRTRRLVDVAVGPVEELYVLGELDGQDVEIVKFTPLGAVSTVIPNASAGSIAVNGEYYLYTTYYDRTTGEHVTRREDVDSTTATWVRREPGTSNSNRVSLVEVDAKGDVYSVFSISATQSRVVKRSIVGETLWTNDLARVNAADASLTHLFLAGGGSGLSVIWRVDPASGNSQRHEVQNGASYLDVHVRPDGSAVALVPNSSSPQWVVTKLTTGFQTEFFASFPRAAGSSGAIALDALGNVYAATSSAGSAEIRKFSTATAAWPGDQASICPLGGCLSWAGITGVPDGVWIDTEVDSGPTDLIVTGSGDVITTGQSTNNTWRTIRLGQAWQSAPFKVIQTNIRFLASGQSIWFEGDDPGIHETLGVIPPSYPADTITWSDFGESIGESVDIPLLGDFGAELGIDIGGHDGPSDSEGNLRFEASVSAGSVDVDYAMVIEADVPGDPRYLIPGRQFQFVAGCNIDPASGFRISPMQADVRLLSRLKSTLDIDVAIEAFDIGIDEEDFPVIGDVLPITIDDDIELLSLADAGTFNLGLIEGTIRVPEIAPHVSVSGDLSNCSDRALVGIERETFFSLVADSLTNYITSQFGLPTALELPLGYAGIGIFIDLAVLQLRTEFHLMLEQEFTYTAREPMIELLDPATHLPLGPAFPPSSPPTLVMPASGQLAFQPRVYLPRGVNFRNETRLILNPKSGFDTIRAGIEVDFGPVGFGDELCALCEDFIDEEISIPVYETEFELTPDGLSSAFEPVLLAPVRLIGSSTSAPELAGLSRTSVTTYLYDQRRVDGPDPQDIAAVRAEFAVFASGSTPIVLTGQRFRTPLENPVRAVFWIYGAERSLPTTWLDDGQLLVQFPNYLRLIPGIGRFWVETDGLDCNGDEIPPSNTIDFSIETPRPNILAVAPNMWAADPDFADVPLVVDDGLNPRGGDSYIARRDYYIQLRALWQSWPARPVPQMGTLFPEFDFEALPARPMIVWNEVDANGVTLANRSLRPFGEAFSEPVDSGKLVSQIPRAYFSMPKRVQLQLLSPGPGGGISNALPLIVAAPQPVIDTADGLRPAQAPPGSGPLRVLVRGPQDVPDPLGIGLQGNFNAASVVRWDGVDLPTIFLDSSRLLAEVAPAQLLAGSHSVTVFTPDRGSVYLNPTLPGCDEINPPSFCFAPSGGTSNAVSFNIQYETPTIRVDDPNTALNEGGLSPSCFAQFLLDLMPIVAPDSGFSNELTITGTGFAPASVARWNGQPRVTTFVSTTRLRVQLEPHDLRVAGSFPVTVVNPQPGGGVSNALSACVSVAPSTLVVDDNGPADTTTIQGAIDIAYALNGLQPSPPAIAEIVVRPGTYHENLDLRGVALLLRGEDAPGSVLSTVVDAGGAGNALRAVSGEGPATIIRGITFANGASTDGGAAHVLNASPTFQRCVFRDSFAQTQGGGIDLIFSNSTLEGCLVVSNQSGNQGGGIYAFGGSPTVVNCTVVANSASVGIGGVGHAGGGGLIAIRNSIVWDNTAPAQSNLGGITDVSYSLVAGGAPGTANLDADPRFVNAPTDLRLASQSPAIDAGNNTLVSAGISVDLFGDGRFFDDAGVSDTGAGTPPLVDRGCLERQVASDPPCAGDLNGDGTVALTDLATLLSNFGGAGTPQEGDIDGDGLVSLTDLALLLSRFGTSCP